MTKVALDPRSWAVAYVCRPKHVYIGTLLHTLLGFQIHKKDKFFEIMVKVWNESHID